MRPRGAGAQLAPGYEVVQHIARANVLDVYDAWSHELGSRCVVKTLRPDRRADAGARRGLLREGELLTQLCHPSIVRGYEVLRDPHPAVVMETLGGETVSHLIERRDLTAREIAFLGLQLGSAIRYLHRREIVHLDLKPSNVIAENGRAKLIDLNLARRPGRVRPGVGTWCYMAPEQARGGFVGPPADVWGIGIILYAAAAGDTPFGEGDEEHPQLHARAPALRGERPRFRRRLSEAIDACLEPEPPDRPSVDELLAALEPVAGGRG
jgi:eukaryotic-like serine/threonine-protein kinase